MKRETILKMIVILIIGVTLLARPLNILAADGKTDLNNFGNWEDAGDKSGLTPETTTTDTDTTTDTSTTTTQDKNETLPNAGLAEDTMMLISIIALGTLAIFAYRKINEYQNI